MGGLHLPGALACDARVDVSLCHVRECGQVLVVAWLLLSHHPPEFCGSDSQVNGMSVVSLFIGLLVGTALGVVMAQVLPARAAANAAKKDQVRLPTHTRPHALARCLVLFTNRVDAGRHACVLLAGAHV